MTHRDVCTSRDKNLSRSTTCGVANSHSAEAVIGLKVAQVRINHGVELSSLRFCRFRSFYCTDLVRADVALAGFPTVMLIL